MNKQKNVMIEFVSKNMKKRKVRKRQVGIKLTNQNLHIFYGKTIPHKGGKYVKV